MLRMLTFTWTFFRLPFFFLFQINNNWSKYRTLGFIFSSSVSTIRGYIEFSRLKKAPLIVCGHRSIAVVIVLMSLRAAFWFIKSQPSPAGSIFLFRFHFCLCFLLSFCHFPFAVSVLHVSLDARLPVCHFYCICGQVCVGLCSFVFAYLPLLLYGLEGEPISVHMKGASVNQVVSVMMSLDLKKNLNVCSTQILHTPEQRYSSWKSSRLCRSSIKLPGNIFWSSYVHFDTSLSKNEIPILAHHNNSYR